MDTYTDLPIEVQRKELQKYVDSVKMLLGDSINEYTKEEKSLNPWKILRNDVEGMIRLKS